MDLCTGHTRMYPTTSWKSLVTTFTFAVGSWILATSVGNLSATRGGLRRHIKEHAKKVDGGIQVEAASKKNVSPEEKDYCRCAMVKFVRDGDWRRANYITEPRKIHALIVQLAIDMEKESDQNPEGEFARRFGKLFARWKHACTLSPVYHPVTPKKQKTQQEKVTSTRKLAKDATILRQKNLPCADQPFGIVW